MAIPDSKLYYRASSSNGNIVVLAPKQTCRPMDKIEGPNRSAHNYAKMSRREKKQHLYQIVPGKLKAHMHRPIIYYFAHK